MPDPTPIPYSLVPWVRRGLASLISGRLLGPGDITSLDAAAIIRTDPRNGADAFEPNYLAMVELAPPDLPWLFTPAAPDGDHLRPWIYLLVISDGDGVKLDVPPSGPAVLQLDGPVDLGAELPDLTHVGDHFKDHVRAWPFPSVANRTATLWRVARMLDRTLETARGAGAGCAAGQPAGAAARCLG
jgi:hypothetical protein